MNELDKLLMAGISFLAIAMGGYIVKLHMDRVSSDKEHKEEIKSLTIQVLNGMTQITKAIDTMNDKLLSKIGRK